MNFQICTGIQEQTGVTKQGDKVFFSIQAPEGTECKLMLYPRDNGTVLKIPMKAEDNMKTLYTVGVQGLDWETHDYNFLVDAKEATDPYARKISGRGNLGRREASAIGLAGGTIRTRTREAAQSAGRGRTGRGCFWETAGQRWR